MSSVVFRAVQRAASIGTLVAAGTLSDTMTKLSGACQRLTRMMASPGGDGSSSRRWRQKRPSQPAVHRHSCSHGL